MSAASADVLLTGCLLYYLGKAVTDAGGRRFFVAGKILKSTIANNGLTAAVCTVRKISSLVSILYLC